VNREQAIEFARDWSVLIAAILVYFLLRARAPVDVDEAVRVTAQLIRFEKGVHVFYELDLQKLILRARWLETATNATYSYLHFPALFAMGALLWFRDRSRFRLVRNTMYVSMVIGLVFYYTIPAAPPRLMDLHGYHYGFVDTVFGTTSNGSVPYPQPGFYVNDYAAIPSFHFGWIALAAWGLWISGPSWIVRTIAVLMTAVMTFASAATANHLFVDMAIGGAVVLISAAVAAYAPRGIATARTIWLDRSKARPGQRRQSQRERSGPG
jgi:hypothetical protein